MEEPTVTELRQALVSSGHFTEEEAISIKGKSNLKYELMKINGEVGNTSHEVNSGVESLHTDMPFDGFPEQPFYDGTVEEAEEEFQRLLEEVDYVVDTNDSAHVKVPDVARHMIQFNKFSDERHQYIMSLFQRNELWPSPQDPEQMLPNINGLRRVGYEMMADVISSGPIDTKVSTLNEMPYATVTYELIVHEVEPGRFFDPEEPPVRVYRAVADCWALNGPQGGGSIYASAMAETRAEGRAWRKALGINVVSYEEISSNNGIEVMALQGIVQNTTGELNMDAPISNIVKNTIMSKCKQLGIDVHKFINRQHFLNPTEFPEPKFASIDDVTKEFGVAMLREINSYQNDAEKAKDIPKEIKL